MVAPAQSGITHVYRNGEEADQCTILESLGGGVGIVDFDNDGRPDICAPGGGGFSGKSTFGLPTALYQNQGNWHFADCSQPSRIRASAFYTHGLAVGDYNNDGFSDVAITGYTGLMLWTNQGDGTFVEQSALAGIDHKLWSSSAAWGDLDNDGDLDLYVTNYVDWSFDNHPLCKSADGRRDICPPKTFRGLPDRLYFNSGDGTFAVADNEATGLQADGKGLGVLILDVNADRRADIYVANDTTNNFLYMNQGGGRFEEQGVLSGVALDDLGLPNGSMGVDAMDYNRDGLMDLWVCNYEDETFALYRNMGENHFVHSSKATGFSALGQRFVGFGTACADFDHDGDEDVVVTNGHVIKFPQRSPRKQLPLVLENREGRFRRSAFSDQNYFGSAHEGRGLATVDLDGDGDLDVVVSHLNEPLALLRNAQKSSRSLMIKLHGRSTNRDAIGASVLLHTTAGTQMRVIKGGGSYLSAHDLTIHFGLAADQQPLKLEINWPSGSDQVITDLSQPHLVIQENLVIPKN